ncbi:hypothetical protein BRYFOR_06618 [Marvinbryantia formatexigens DSM 14469]|uniref:Uncharacterized protein n=1 Tax=Marvinbryantia formatexigens DSM 14469 TaxID=478749 RepID=C6LDK9_9FIRM|nr:hypothetical protein BRYFOR_06618 [Marvinbryantia formatexigens DSM 14469]
MHSLRDRVLSFLFQAMPPSFASINAFTQKRRGVSHPLLFLS